MVSQFNGAASRDLKIIFINAVQTLSKIGQSSLGDISVAITPFIQEDLP